MIFHVPFFVSYFYYYVLPKGSWFKNVGFMKKMTLKVKIEILCIQ